MKKNVSYILLFLVSAIAFSQTILYKGKQIFLIANDYEIIHASCLSQSCLQSGKVRAARNKMHSMNRAFWQTRPNPSVAVTCPCSRPMRRNVLGADTPLFLSGTKREFSSLHRCLRKYVYAFVTKNWKGKKKKVAYRLSFLVSVRNEFLTDEKAALSARAKIIGGSSF